VKGGKGRGERRKSEKECGREEREGGKREE